MTDPAGARTRWDVVFLAVFAGIFTAFQIGKAPAALPILRAELEMGLVTAGWVISMFNVIGIVAGMSVGAVADRLGHRHMVALGLVITALASAAGALSQGAEGILLSRFAEGVGFIMTVVAGPGLIAAVARPVHHKLAFGFWGSYMPAGTAAMVLVAPAIMGAWGWRGLWLVNAILLFGFALALMYRTRDMPALSDKPGSHTNPAIALRMTLAAPAPWLLALCFACYTWQFISVMGFLPVMLIEERGFDVSVAAVLVALAIATNVPGNLLGGMLLHREWPRWALIMIASSVMGISSFGIYSEALPELLRYGLVLQFSLFAGLLPTSVLGAAPVFAPKPALVGTTAGLIMQGSNLGQTIGPPAVGALVTAWGSWTAAPMVLCAAAGLAFAFGAALRRLERERSRSANRGG